MEKVKDDTPGDKVYVIAAHENGPAKIGVSIDMRDRLMNLQNGSHQKLKVYSVWQGRTANAYRAEKAAHAEFHNRRLAGEWFDISVADAEAFLAGLYGEYDRTGEDLENHLDQKARAVLEKAMLSHPRHGGQELKNESTQDISAVETNLERLNKRRPKHRSSARPSRPSPRPQPEDISKSLWERLFDEEPPASIPQPTPPEK